MAAQRRVDYLVRSDSLPDLTVSVSGKLQLLGHIRFPVDSVALAEEFVFGEGSDSGLERAVIVHFEHFLPGSTHRFVYSRLRMVRLGSEEYLHQTWAFADLDLFHEPALAAMLRDKGMAVGKRWVMDRYVRAVQENSQYEVIIFYLEAGAISDPSIRYGGAPVAPPPPPTPPAAVEVEIHRRARLAFTVWPSALVPAD
jgi:hypothetical protein